MRKLFKAMTVVVGLLAFAACDAEAIDGSISADGDDGNILEENINDDNDDGLPDLPL